MELLRSQTGAGEASEPEISASHPRERRQCRHSLKPGAQQDLEPWWGLPSGSWDHGAGSVRWKLELGRKHMIARDAAHSRQRGQKLPGCSPPPLLCPPAFISASHWMGKRVWEMRHLQCLVGRREGRGLRAKGKPQQRVPYPHGQAQPRLSLGPEHGDFPRLISPLALSALSYIADRDEQEED